MNPFNRQRHNSASANQHTKSARSIRSSKAYHEERRYESEPPSPQSPVPPYSRHWSSNQDLTQDILRAKEKVLLSSLGQPDLCDYHPEDNKQRLGANRQPTFHSLKRIAEPSLNPANDVINSKDADTSTSKVFPDDLRLCHFNKPNSLDIRENLNSATHLGSNSTDLALCQDMIDLKQNIDCLSLIKLSAHSPELIMDSFDLQQTNKELEMNETLKSVETSSVSSSSEEQNNKTIPGPEYGLESAGPDGAVVDVPSSAISVTMATELKQVVVGSAKDAFSTQWLGQGFVFNSHHSLRYGFVQNKGGACGVLSTVQAHLVRVLLFDPRLANLAEPLRPTTVEARSGLVVAITDVLWQAGSRQGATLAVRSESSHLSDCGCYGRDGLTDALHVFTFNCREDLEQSVRQHERQFTEAGASGCLLLVFSVVLSRGLARVKEDMDEPSPLIDQNGYCLLELVNLVLTGRAVSNVFDNTLQVDSCLLRGVHTRADIGFLSLFEHYNSCQVGSFLKTPRFPIWVVCSENHFTVLFSCRRELVSDWRAEKRFNLYHYDGMSRQHDEIRLTVDTTGLHLNSRSSTDRVPPLEHCIRTKWKDAVIDWNGCEPSL